MESGVLDQKGLNQKLEKKGYGMLAAAVHACCGSRVEILATWSMQRRQESF